MSRVCGYCTGSLVRHDDVVPWKCTVCNRLLYDSDTVFADDGGRR